MPELGPGPLAPELPGLGSSGLKPACWSFRSAHFIILCKTQSTGWSRGAEAQILPRDEPELALRSYQG